MNIDKEYLDNKLQLFISQQEEVVRAINANIALNKKLEGAIEAIQLLIKESQINNTEDNND